MFFGSGSIHTDNKNIIEIDKEKNKHDYDVIEKWVNSI